MRYFGPGVRPFSITKKAPAVSGVQGHGNNASGPLVGVKIKSARGPPAHPRRAFLFFLHLCLSRHTDTPGRFKRYPAVYPRPQNYAEDRFLTDYA